jgi:hypothetical protein
LVQINGHAVHVEGKQRWRVRLPLETVRSWSVPFARTIEVTLLDPSNPGEGSHKAKLPIGLLGHVSDLASLVVTAK